MAIIVEDGSKVAGANSYVSLEDAFNYHLTYGNTDFTNGAADYATFITGDVSVQTAAVVNSAMLLDLLFGPTYIGFPSSAAQALLWPRIPTVYGTPYTYDYVGYQSYVGLRDAYGLFRPTNVVPPEVVKAQEQAMLQLVQGDDLLPTQIDKTSYLKMDRVDVGDLKVIKEYFRMIPSAKLQMIKAILYPIIMSGNKLIRG